MKQSTSTRQLREQEELEQCTFQPKLIRRKSTKSHLLADPLDYAERSVDETIEGGRKPEDLIKWGADKENKLAALRIKHTDGPDAECRFKPMIDSNSKKLLAKSYVKIEDRVKDCLLKKEKSV